MKNYELLTSAPGRICLFGEHQDYLNLPVIAYAISLRTTIKGKKRSDNKVFINLPDINSKEEFLIDDVIKYKNNSDFYKSSLNVLKKNGFTFSFGCDCELTGKIPINSGTSSSSALIVAWIKFLAKISDQNIDLEPHKVAEYAFLAEVAEFSAPGGRMDQYASALGNLSLLDFYPELQYSNPKRQLGSFVLGDSGEEKDTIDILSRVKDKILEINKYLQTLDNTFSIRTTNLSKIAEFENKLPKDQYDLLLGTFDNYKITLKAQKLLKSTNFNDLDFGKLLIEHHSNLRDIQKISTNKIDRMINASLKAGALGGKINGSGGGGCMFAYAPNNPENIAQAIEKEGGKAYIINNTSGVIVEDKLLGVS